MARALAVATALSLFAMSPARTYAADSVQDFVMSPAPGALPAQKSQAVSKFKFMFGGPARWQGTLHWRYNPANAPAQFNDANAVVNQLVAQSAKWTSVCGVQFAYDGPTTAVPQTLAGGPDGVSVIGWGKPDMGVSGATYVWYQSSGNNMTLVESDMFLVPSVVTTQAQFIQTVSHEWGHAIGLAHSNLEGTLMSGPPDSMYTNASTLAPDDVHGCRCLYGPAAGQTAGNVCSLPELIDFGTLSVGAASTENAVTVTNSGNGPLTITGIRTNTSEFAIGSNSCTAGMALAPGASCAFGVLARLASAGERGDQVTIDTSEGPYEIPLDATGVAAAQSTALNFEGSWWNSPGGSESGWGLNLAHQGDTIFASWFTYDAAGKSSWLTMTANRTGNNVFSGKLYQTRGPAFNTVPFDSSAVTYQAVGTGTLAFSDSNNGTFTYTVNGISGNKAITRTVFGSLPVCTAATQAMLATATNYQDIWSAAASGESGWGVYVTHQGTTIFATWFSYDFDGSPLWLSMTTSQNATGVYSGTLYRTTGPSFGTAFDPSKVAYAPVGNATLTFGDGDDATFAYSVTLGSPPVTVTQAKHLSRLVFQSPGTVCR
ncbi:MAG TPA: choice-of-anchor D domain-containing protein [Casimicrobiaceae bacterium]|nr:choice-of-anchor D domain-containing protein [Casimicrobiaceae bacterium]